MRLVIALVEIFQKHLIKCVLVYILLGGSEACAPEKVLLNGAIWCVLMRFGVYLDQILSLNNFQNYLFFI